MGACVLAGSWQRQRRTPTVNSTQHTQPTVNSFAVELLCCHFAATAVQSLTAAATSHQTQRLPFLPYFILQNRCTIVSCVACCYKCKWKKVWNLKLILETGFDEPWDVKVILYWTSSGSGCHNLLQPYSQAARKWGENEEMETEIWNGDREMKWREMGEMETERNSSLSINSIYDISRKSLTYAIEGNYSSKASRRVIHKRTKSHTILLNLSKLDPAHEINFANCRSCCGSPSAPLSRLVV